GRGRPLQVPRQRERPGPRGDLVRDDDVGQLPPRQADALDAVLRVDEQRGLARDALEAPHGGAHELTDSWIWGDEQDLHVGEIVPARLSPAGGRALHVSPAPRHYASTARGGLRGVPVTRTRPDRARGTEGGKVKTIWQQAIAEFFGT